MTGLIVLLAIVILILLISILNRANEQHAMLRSFRKEIEYLSDRIEKLADQRQQGEPGEREKSTVIPDRKTAPPPPKPVIQPPPPPVVATPETPVEIKPEPDTIYKKTEEPVLFNPVEKKVSPRKKDLEKFIGENLANKIGIAVLVLGISFFVKYAIDRNWINEGGRVLIGLLSGSILIGIAHYIRKNYRSFSSVLVGGGLTVFYFSIAFAFHEYHLVGQQGAFLYMVAVTVLAVLLSLLYDRQELAILSIIGGFVTPFLVSTGNENHVVLFTYLAILNAGMMILAWFKYWPAVNIISLFFTTLIYGAWLLKRIFLGPGELPYRPALFFATLFYLLFMTMSVINNLRLKRKFDALDFMIVLSINFLYYIAGMAALERWADGAFKGVFTASLGIFNCLLLFVFYRKKAIDRNFLSLLTGLAIAFISLTAPVQFRGNHVVLFWAAESVILVWLYQRSSIMHLRFASRAVLVLMLFSLGLTWINTYFSGGDGIPVVVNKGFITSMAVAAALFVYYRLLRNETPDQSPGLGVLKNSVLTASLIVAYLGGIFELYYQFRTHYPHTGIYAVYLQTFSFLFAVVVLYLFRRSSYISLLKFLLPALCFTLYLLHLSLNAEISFRLFGSANASLFSAHWLGSLLMGWLLYSVITWFYREKNKEWTEYRPAFTWAAVAGIVILLSAEMYHVFIWTADRQANKWEWWENLYYKAGLTILWSICSFTMMWVGMKLNFRTLRIISLTLFTITVLKLFLYDIRRIPPGGKIAAFILLGVLLLTVSFMYQRLKKIIIDEPPAES